MKKWLIWIAICLVIIIASLTLLLPWGMGFAVQHKYTAILESLSQSEHVKMKLLNYQRGWFHSDAAVEVTLTQPSLLEINRWLGNEKTKGAPIQFTLNQHIQHGPFLRIVSETGQKRFLFGRAVVKSNVKTALGNMDSITFVELDGSLLSVINAPELHLVNSAQYINATVNGLTATLLLSSDLNQIYANIDVPEGTITTTEFLQKINNLSEQFSLRKSPSGLYLGWRTTKISDASWETIDHKSQIQLNGLTMQSQSAENSAKMTYKLNTILNKVVVDNNAYGPQQLKLSLNNLDVPTLLALRKELTQINRTEALLPTQLLRYNDLFMILLNKGLEVNIEKLNLVLASGNLIANMQMVIKPQSTTTTNLADFLHNLDAKAHLKIPDAMLTEFLTSFGNSAMLRAMTTSAGVPNGSANPNAEPLQQAKQQIDQWILKKWLIPEDNSYILDLFYKNQQLRVNGIVINQQQNT
ncbi:MAG TPA: YdgA family protein [Gammaproteobacteria bacterium]|nr:YdgA family protein [Gammaproteobacteria bacterium]